MHGWLPPVNLMGSRSTSLETPGPCPGAGKVGDVSPPGVHALGFTWGLWTCVFVPPSSGCPQGCTVLSSSSGDMRLRGESCDSAVDVFGVLSGLGLCPVATRLCGTSSRVKLLVHKIPWGAKNQILIR